MNGVRDRVVDESAFAPLLTIASRAIVMKSMKVKSKSMTMIMLMVISLRVMMKAKKRMIVKKKKKTGSFTYKR